MSETQTPQTATPPEEAAKTQAPSTPEATPQTAPATKSKIDWNEKANLYEDDLYVQVTDPLFDRQTVLATIQQPEIVGADAQGNGEAVRLSFKIEEELVDTLGNKKAPGYIWRPRFADTIRAATSKDKEQEERGLKSLARLAETVQVLPRKSAHSAREIVKALGGFPGKQVKIKFTVKEGNKRDEETGEKVKFQNVRFAAPEADEKEGGAGDY